MRDNDLFNVTDEFGNELKLMDGVVFLKKHEENFNRKICFVTEKPDIDRITLIYYYDKSSHLIKINNSLGINYTLLSLLKDTDIIKFIEKNDNDFFIFTVKRALEIGSFLHFKTEGVEKLFYIPLNKIAE